MSKATYIESDEIATIAKDLIEKYHQHLIDFSVKIRYVFTDVTPKSAGKEVWGTCKKVSGLNAYLEGNNDTFFVITISKDIWDILPQDKRIALIDHELCHAWAEVKKNKENEEDAEIDNPVKLSIKPHDLEEFSCIVRRHGLWREDIEDFVEAATKSKQKNEN